jgi:hypothetical protein
MKGVATARDIEGCAFQPTQGIGPLEVNQAATLTRKTFARESENHFILTAIFDPLPL